VLDTNVKLDIYSCHDVTGSHDPAITARGAAALHEPRMVYRRARARESLLLAIHLHKVGATTFNLHHESIALLTRTAPPTAVGGQSIEAEFVVFFLHFVKDYILPNWLPVMPREPGSEMSNIADTALLDVAREHGLPLITNEGYTPDGIRDEKLRKRALDAGVRVFTPREFYADKIDETAEVAWFLGKFVEEMPDFLAAREREMGKRDLAEDVLKLIHGYYRLVLLGQSEGGLVPVRVTP
jgi:hypothetical protein